MTRGHFGNHAEKWHLRAYGTFGLPLAFRSEGGDSSKTFWAGAKDGQEGWVCERCGSAILAEPLPAESDDRWVCPACGEVVPGKFDSCWKCQHRRPPPEEIVRP